MAPLVFKSYPNEEKLCVILHLKLYLSQTKNLRNCKSLFISYIKPHQAVTRDSKRCISRWCKVILTNCGINVKHFFAHSNRSASSSKSLANNVPLSNVISNAGWSNERTFASRYNKVVIEDINLLNALTKKLYFRKLLCYSGYQKILCLDHTCTELYFIFLIEINIKNEFIIFVIFIVYVFFKILRYTMKSHFIPEICGIICAIKLSKNKRYLPVS